MQSGRKSLHRANKSIKSLVFATLTALFAVSLAKPARLSAQELPKLDIGVVLPLSGPQAAYGQEMLRGMQVAVEQLTASEPKLAGKIQLVTGDEKSQTSEAGIAAADLIEKQRVHILIGSVTTPATLAVAAVARKLQRPLITPLATGRAITVGGYVYRINLDDASQGALLANFAKSVLNQGSAAILRDDTESALAVAGGFTQTFQEAGGKITNTEVYDLASDNFKTVLEKLRDKKTTLIVLPAYFQTAAAIMQQAKKLKLNATFLGNDSWDTPELQKIAGASAKNHFFAAQFAVDDPDPTTVAFVQVFKAKYKRDPGSIAALGYDSVKLAIDAMRRANGNMPAQLVKALDRTQDFQGACGGLTLKPQGEMSKAAAIKVTTDKTAVFKTRMTAAAVVAPISNATPSGQSKGH